MSTLLSVRRKPFIIGVMGGHNAPPAVLEEAFRLGEEIARRGHVLLTGGGDGVMEAASKGACSGGGLVIAILPSERNRPSPGYPNPYVDIPVYTGMADARNAINVKTPHVVVALSGSAGTLSEIALALACGTPVIGLNAPRFTIPGMENFTDTNTVEEALKALDKIIKESTE
jgi:uncharacterized protein (TIGR00725 family)